MANCNNPHENINHENIFKRAWKGAEKLGEKYEDKVDSFFSKVEEKFDNAIDGNNPIQKGLKGLTVPKEVREVAEMVNAYRADTVEMAKNATKIADFLREKLSEEDSVALTRALAEDGAVPLHLKNLYIRFRKVIDQNAKKLVDNGALAEENTIKDYLKRYYKEYLDKKESGLFSLSMKKVFKRQDLTHEERLALGLVEDADFVIANTILEQNQQLHKAKLLKRIADTFAIDEQKEGYTRVSDETVGGGIYRYGALAGKYVPDRVYGELKGARVLSETMRTFSKWEWTDFVDHIKVNVTVKNPGTHLYNLWSNMMMAYLNGDLIALGKVTKMMIEHDIEYRQKVSSLRKRGLKKDKAKELAKEEIQTKFKKLVNLARKFGLNNEIEDYEHLTVGIDHKKDKNILVKVLKNLYFAEGTALGKGIRKVYGFEDEIFKLASFYRRIEGKKLSTATAKHHFKEAMADYVDYTTPLPPMVRALDKNGIFPFSHYVWKSTPRTAKIIIKNPLKFALLQVILYKMGASLFNEDDNLEKADWAGDKGFAGLIPFIPSNLFGAKQWVKLDNDEYINLGRALPGMRLGGLAFDGGFVGSFLSIMQGKDSLWGSKIYKESDSPLQASFKSLQKFAENYAPPLTYGRYAQRLAKKATGFRPKKNDFDEEMSYKEILQQMVGVRKFNSSKQLKKHYKAVVKAFKDGNIDADEMDKKLTAILIYAEEHDIEIDVSKIKTERAEDFSYFGRYFI